MTSPHTIQEIRSRLEQRRALTFDESFELARHCGELLRSAEKEGDGRDLVIRAMEYSGKLPEGTRELWADLVEVAGLYPYLQPEVLKNGALLRYEYHQSNFLDGVYLHREQLRISDLLHSGKSIVLSAPTSFGKSLLIQELVASGRYKNIVIVQPTLALLDETRKKLQQYGDKYRIVVSTHQGPGDDNNIFLFTGERVVEYSQFPAIDFFIIDEFYKLSLSRDDERAVTLNQALYRLLKHTSKYYLLGPSIRNVSDEFVSKTEGVWVRTDFATVAVDVIPVSPQPRRKPQQGRQGKEASKQAQLFELLSGLSEPTMIYCASPAKASRLATEFARQVKRASGASKTSKNNDIVEWIAENIHAKWCLSDALQHGVAFHHGAVPRHLGSSIVDAFNDRSIRYLFCTSTLIEGVNTTARNVVLYDEAKGKKPIDYFDYKNIVGRSGRMKIHYIGKVYQLTQRPQQIEIDVDVPLFSQGDAPLELLLQLDKSDLEPAGRARLDAVLASDPALVDVIKRNASVSVEGQLALYGEISSNAAYYWELLSWATIPKYEQLYAAIALCWRFLMKEGESKGGVSDRQLAYMTLQYASVRSTKAMIDHGVNSAFWKDREPDEDERVQKIVYQVLNVTRQWFEYRLPKLLTALSEVQRFAFERIGRKPGNYSYLSAQLENAFLKGSLSTLLDYDVPMSAVRKIEGFFKDQNTWAEIVSGLRHIDFKRLSLLPYERRKIEGILKSSK